MHQHIHHQHVNNEQAPTGRIDVAQIDDEFVDDLVGIALSAPTNEVARERVYAFLAAASGEPALSRRNT